MLKNQKGITLIALIITIIVMLILVGVTINVALNGGLFTKAEIAKVQTIKELEKEELMSIVVSAYDSKSRGVKKSELKFNGKYTEETDKTTEEKVVVKGESGTLWQIDIDSAKVEEYTQAKEPQFYGVAYENLSLNAKYYFLENGIVLGYDKGGQVAVYYTINDNVITFGPLSNTISEDLSKLSGDRISLDRNETDIYEYNPVYDSIKNVYKNAFYTSTATGNIISTSEDLMWIDGMYSNSDISFAEMESEGIILTNNGETITFEENVYNLVK